MAVTKTIVKRTHQEVVVKIAGTAGSATVSLASDLLPAAGQVLDGATQTVNIVGAGWSGLLTSAVTVARGGANVLTVAGENSSYFDLDGQNLPPEITNNTQDIVVTISGAEAQIWLKLRKVGGYKTTVEPEQFGPYDNPAVAGS